MPTRIESALLKIERFGLPLLIGLAILNGWLRENHPVSRITSLVLGGTVFLGTLWLVAIIVLIFVRSRGLLKFSLRGLLLSVVLLNVCLALMLTAESGELRGLGILGLILLSFWIFIFLLHNALLAIIDRKRRREAGFDGDD